MISTFNVSVIVDKLIDEIIVEEYDALAIPGGFEEFGVAVVNERIVVDENIITSYCPETAADVAFELLKKLIGFEKMVR